MKNKLEEIKDIIEKWESKCDEADNKDLGDEYGSKKAKNR